MTEKFNHDEKYKLYSFLMQHGFDILQKPESLQKAIPKRDLSEIKALLEAYKKINTVDSSNIWIDNILNLRQHYKHDAFQELLADVLKKKADSLSPNDQYRDVYLFLSKILSGIFPDVENTNDHTIMVILVLLQDLNKLITEVTDGEVYSFLRKTNHDKTEANRKEQLDSQEMKRLKSLFKFQRLNEFLNPLEIPNNINEKVYKNIFK